MRPQDFSRGGWWDWYFTDYLILHMVLIHCHHETTRFFSWWGMDGWFWIFNMRPRDFSPGGWGTDIFLSTNWLLDLTHGPNSLSPRDHEIFLMVGDGWFWIFTMRPRDFSCGGVWMDNFKFPPRDHENFLAVGGGMDDCKFPPRNHETFLVVGVDDKIILSLCFL